MNSIESLRQFFGWCAAINLGILVVSSILLLLFRGLVARVHARLFGLSEPEVIRDCYHYLAHYKIATFILAMVPYVALRMMT